MSRTCKFLFALLTLFILIGCQKRQMRSEIRLPMAKAESIQTKTIATVGNITQKEMAWRNLVEQLPDVSDMATFPVSGEAWNPESITLQRGETVYWVDQSEDWNASKICTRISGRTHCLYTAKDGSLPQLAAFEDMLFFTQPDGIYRMSMNESKPELWIPNGGQVTLTGGVIYTWLSELDFFAIAVEKPEEAVCVWRQNADFELRQYVPVTGGMVFWLEEKESEGSVSRVWTVLLRNCGQWTLLHEETGELPSIIFSQGANVWLMRETGEGQFLYNMNCESGTSTLVGRLPDAPEECYRFGIPLLGFGRLLMRYQGMDDSVKIYALGDDLCLQEHLLSYGGADGEYAIYSLQLFEVQETEDFFYFRGKSKEDGYYLVTRMKKTENGLSSEEVLSEQA